MRPKDLIDRHTYYYVAPNTGWILKFIYGGWFSIDEIQDKNVAVIKLKFKNGEYLCPVKEKQLNTPGALCRFCVSKQDKDV